jgi:hypothetical protein
MRADRVKRWLQEPILSIHSLVTELGQDSEAGLPYMLVAESGVNIMNECNEVADAFEKLRSS